MTIEYQIWLSRETRSRYYPTDHPGHPRHDGLHFRQSRQSRQSSQAEYVGYYFTEPGSQPSGGSNEPHVSPS